MALRNFNRDARKILEYLKENQAGDGFTDVKLLLSSMTDFEVGTFMEKAVRNGLLEQGTQVPTTADLNMSSIVRLGANAGDFLIDRESEG
ncbi:MAG: hypothetical protein INR73_00720 [Williamsia sp.]|nr:hypothetical protein [Williamsia sp.]